MPRNGQLVPLGERQVAVYCRRAINQIESVMREIAEARVCIEDDAVKRRLAQSVTRLWSVAEMLNEIVEDGE